MLQTLFPSSRTHPPRNAAPPPVTPSAATQALDAALCDLPPFRLRVELRVLHFRRPARTSRGDLRERPVLIIHAEGDGYVGEGECSLMPGLSPEAGRLTAERINEELRRTEAEQALLPEALNEYPALRFGLEGALLSLRSRSVALWDTPFTRGEEAIAIHHLVWMDTAEHMQQALRRGAENGAVCLKLKVGALPLNEEIALLRDIRAEFPQVEIRVDANGAFSPEEAPPALAALAEAGVSCIEQPIAPGQTRALGELCRSRLLPIALDEELIAPGTRGEREQLLEAIRPQALVIKPSLHGGLRGAARWADLAEERGIRWWINSALESHIGHSILTQWCGLCAPQTLHGLGTGHLFSDDSLRDIILRGHHLHWKIPASCGTKEAAPQ